jgi:hypothetical protein
VAQRALKKVKSLMTLKKITLINELTNYYMNQNEQ